MEEFRRAGVAAENASFLQSYFSNLSIWPLIKVTATVSILWSAQQLDLKEIKMIVPPEMPGAA